MSETVSIQSFSAFVSGVVTTFCLPLIFLVLDYVLRYQAVNTAADELILQSGPDCCILSLGVMGAVFADRAVRSVDVLMSPTAILLTIAIILVLRFLCLGAARNKQTRRSVTLGLTSVTTILLIPTIAFVSGRLHR